MKKIRNIWVLVILVGLLTACRGQPTVLPTGIPTLLPTAVLTPTAAEITPTTGELPTAEVPAATETIGPTTAPVIVPTGLPDISDQTYLDDRSTPAALMLSYFNAVNRREYLRAYAYYTDTTTVGTLDNFSKGYENTKNVAVVFGPIFSGGAAGSIYYTVPMVLNAVTTAGVQQKFAACYVVRLPQPGNYGAPPITPMHLVRGTAKAAALTAADADLLANACPQPDFPTGPDGAKAAVESVTDISASNYIDNRSDAVTALSSYFNAINKQEYVRAYSYWQKAPGEFANFAAGYATTKSVSVQFGKVIADAGAGQLNYALPVAAKASQTDGTVKTFVGCYNLHLSQPGIQGTLPFQPLGITSGNLNPAAANADIAALLLSACK